MCAATLLIGMARILILPPFEGFDETAHYPASVDGCGAATASACLAYPLFVPMFFPEFTRLRNDALCLLILGTLLALVAMPGRAIRQRASLGARRNALVAMAPISLVSGWLAQPADKAA
jgi:hypothetical protein